MRLLSLLTSRLLILHGRLDSHGDHLFLRHTLRLARVSHATHGKRIWHLHLTHVVEAHHSLKAACRFLLRSRASIIRKVASSSCILAFLLRVLRLRLLAFFTLLHFSTELGLLLIRFLVNLK